MKRKVRAASSECRIYKQVIKDYFLGFFRDINSERVSLLVAWASIGLGFSGVFREQLSYNWLLGIPVVFAVLSGACHNVSLPFMMYLVPYARKQREAYIRKALHVKVAVPMLFAGLCDIGAALLGGVSAYGLTLQLVTVFCVTYVCGMLCDGMMRNTKGKAVYEGLKDFVEIPLMLCQIGGAGMFAACLYPVSRVEFFIILIILMAVMLPTIYVVRKKWGIISRNFADYEKLEYR